ncbi:MAG: isoprenylcysteine carboxylmethyltransferase family protein [Pirellulales bacterium]|nr:isoprenylcysteine carboxylmethyltransferase family protein [Pirellulales bacterium]
MKRWLFLIYGVCCHLLFLGVFACMAAFVGNLLLPKTIDSPSALTAGAAVAVNLALVALFGLQHSIMARPGFKQAWTRFVPPPIERSTYVLVSCLVTILVMRHWQGIDAVVWKIEQPTLRTAAWALFAAGWLMVPVASLLINHFDLFGTRQVWLYFRGREYAALPFRAPLAYRHVRHPLYHGWTLAFWATPTMTAGHLLFAVTMTGYMWGAALLEERDLVRHFGAKYERYRKLVPMIIPRWKPAALEAVVPLAEEHFSTTASSTSTGSLAALTVSASGSPSSS